MAVNAKLTDEKLEKVISILSVACYAVLEDRSVFKSTLNIALYSILQYTSGCER